MIYRIYGIFVIVNFGTINFGLYLEYMNWHLTRNLVYIALYLHYNKECKLSCFIIRLVSAVNLGLFLHLTFWYCKASKLQQEFNDFIPKRTIANIKHFSTNTIEYYYVYLKSVT